MGTAKTAALTSLAMVAFAANSLLCRAALGPRAIDSASFTLVRLASGALVLALLVRIRRPRRRQREANAPRNFASASALFVYAIAFSIAYLSLPTGTGALVLFGCVQATMIVLGIRAGERPRPSAWVAIAIAFAGLVGLTLPGVGAPEPLPAALMAIAGVAWGVYSVRGRGSPDPLGTTAINFAWSVPLALGASAIGLAFTPHATWWGVLLAAASGGLASGIGYSIWYTAMRGLSATSAAVVQLSVPVVAATGGVLLLGEALSPRLVISAAAILGGVAFVVSRR